MAHEDWTCWQVVGGITATASAVALIVTKGAAEAVVPGASFLVLGLCCLCGPAISSCRSEGDSSRALQTATAYYQLAGSAAADTVAVSVQPGGSDSRS